VDSQPSAAGARLEVIEFTAEHLDLVGDFECGHEFWEEEQAEWIRQAPPFKGALYAREKWGTTIWLHLVHIPLQDSPFVFGYSSLGHSNMPGEPYPEGPRKRIQYIPGLAVASQYQGQKLCEKKCSRIIMEHILDVANSREPDLIGLHVYQRNTKAIKLYESYGFKIIGGPDKNNLLGMWRWGC
jgi:ribosomal protein S18 acetylase RimI-like enzyme